MLNILNLIRYKNLLFIIGLQLLMRYAVIFPIFKTFGLETQNFLPLWQFWFVVAASVLIAAGGYVINDYFDTKIDAINRPDKVIVGKAISKNTASRIHQILSAIGIILGLTVAIVNKNLSIGLIFVIVPGLLWFYSASYKRQFLTGNIIVALNAGLIPLIVAISELSFLLNYYGEIFDPIISKTVYTLVLVFSSFAFLGTLIREIIKDMEDITGDREMESRTMPIVMGIKNTKLVLYALIAFTVGLAVHFQVKVINEFIVKGLQIYNQINVQNSPISFKNTFLIIPLLFGFLVYLLGKAKEPKEFNQASNFMKIILIAGSLHAIIIYYLLK